MRVACFVSPHGFGHAARACAVVEALWRRRPELGVDLFTTTPRWFFDLSLGDDETGRVAYHATDSDLGLVQRSALEEDVTATVARLASWLPFDDAELDHLAEHLHRLGTRAVVCDISPLGLAAAGRAGLPSVLVENFTWDWIYRGYDDPDLDRFADLLEPIFAGADRRFQAEPLCRPVAGATRVEPVARRPRQGRTEVRRRLGVPADASLVMVTMGGVPWDYGELSARLGPPARRPWLLVAGGAERVRHLERAVLLPHRADDFYHPDLVTASDVVVGKLGYSTVAEVARGGGRFAYVPRPRFRESPALEAWVRRHLTSAAIAPGETQPRAWLDVAEPLLERPPSTPAADGAEAVAVGILELLGQ